MIKYKKIHIWDFPPTITFIDLYPKYRNFLFPKIISLFGSQQKLVDYLNDFSLEHNLNKRVSRFNLYSWNKGFVLNKKLIKKVNIPLWVLIAILISLDFNLYNEVENNIKSCSCWGKSNIIKNPILPIEITPELVSVIFHFFADGHIGNKGVSSSYRQMNNQGLLNFLNKLKNCFGVFEYSKQEFQNGRLNVPKAITNFYEDFFKLPSTRTMEGFIPENVKKLDKEFLLAGLVAYIIDDGHIGEVITIYSKNKKLLEDIRGISIKCGYITHQIREKYTYGVFDVFRFSISSKSYKKLFYDVQALSKKFPTCDFAHKQKILIQKLR